MNLKYLIALSVLFSATAQAEEMVIYRWDDVCNHTMTTNHFVLAPKEGTQKIYIDLSGCTKEQVGSLLFMGYHTTKNRSRQLSAKDKVRLRMTALDSFGHVADQLSSDAGYALADVSTSNSQGCWLVAENMNRNKEIKVRLFARLISP